MILRAETVDLLADLDLIANDGVEDLAAWVHLDGRRVTVAEAITIADASPHEFAAAEQLFPLRLGLHLAECAELQDLIWQYGFDAGTADYAEMAGNMPPELRERFRGLVRRCLPGEIPGESGT